MRRNIGIISLGTAAIVAINGAGTNPYETIPLFGFFLVLGLILFFTGRTKKQQEQPVETRRSAKKTLFCSHMAGLPLAEGARCSIFFDEGKLSIEGGGTTFDLACDRISDMSIKTDVEIQNAYVSSAGGALGGALLFGPLGAMVGGRVKKKENRTMQSYLIVTYEKDGEIAYLGFNVSGYSRRAYGFIEEFNNSYRGQQRRVEL